MQDPLRKMDRRQGYAHRAPLGELTRITPPRNSERKAAWYAKALKAEYDFMTGPLWEIRARAYEREAMGTSEPEKEWAISGAF